MTDKFKMLSAIEDKLNDLKGKADSALTALYAEGTSGEDEEETRRLQNGVYNILWATVPVIPKVIDELIDDVVAARSALREA